MSDHQGSTAERGCLRGMKILIAEDEWLLADTLAVLVEEEGARVIGPCPTTQDAIRMLSDGPIDFAIVDMNLKDSFSDPLVERLVQMDVPFAIVTGYINLPTNADDRAVWVLHKPADYTALIGLVSTYSAGSRSRDVNR
jgi:ActR/RegA family two-component response regulator